MGGEEEECERWDQCWKPHGELGVEFVGCYEYAIEWSVAIAAMIRWDAVDHTSDGQDFLILSVSDSNELRRRYHLRLTNGHVLLTSASCLVWQQNGSWRRTPDRPRKIDFQVSRNANVEIVLSNTRHAALA